MAKTINSFVADQGEVAITLSAANVAAVTAFTTAEEIVISGVVRSFRRTNNPEVPVAQTKVTGDTSPILTPGRVPDMGEWELVLVDDYHEGLAGEWGTDNLSAVEIFRELFDNGQFQPGALQCTPAGGATGDIETTLVDPVIKAVGEPDIDADATEPATVTILLSSSYSTKAAHA